MQPRYEFRPLTPGDEAMVKRWLAAPHIGGWWGDPDTEWDLLAEEFGQNVTNMQIVCLAGQPFAYVQDYDVHAYHMPHYADLPEGSRALDMFLGDAAFLGQGHACGFLRQRAGVLAAIYGQVTVDPDPENKRAVATYEKAGFVKGPIRPCEDGTPALLMTFTQASPLPTD